LDFVDMNKKTLEVFQILVWIMGAIAVGLLVWGIFRALMS